jgi:hypothetical protein
VLDRIEDLPCGLFLESFLHAAEADVLEVFEPLEIRHSHTAGVDEGIGDHHDTALVEVLARIGRHRAVGGLADDFCLDPRRIVHRDGVFQSGRYQNVALQLEPGIAFLEVPGTGEIEQGAGLAPVGHHVFDVNPLRRRDRALVLDETDDLRAAFLLETGVDEIDLVGAASEIVDFFVAER